LELLYLENAFTGVAWLSSARIVRS